jgi:AcrR family transcriptional regulator
MPLAARTGLTDLGLDGVASRAGVTRNLLYHYFPRGRADLVLAVVTEAERQLNFSSPIDEGPLARLLDHALAPTHAWRIHRAALAVQDPQVRSVVGRRLEELTLELSRASLGTDDPPPLARAALRGYLGFAEAALEEGRSAGLPRSELLGLLKDTLVATLGAARR